MTHELGWTDCMGPLLREEVAQQLLEDLNHYGLSTENLIFDWSETCIEGHRTRHLDGDLENFSSIAVIDPQDKVVAHGWIEFIHGGDPHPLFVFWHLLEVRSADDKWKRLRYFGGIPQHIWDRLPMSIKDLLATTPYADYDGTWFDDPLVKEWRRSKSS